MMAMADTSESNPQPEADDALEAMGYCWKCGYDLRGLGELRCPECGFRFDAEAVKDLNAAWTLERIRGFRRATLLQGAACTILLISILAPVLAISITGLLMFAGMGVALFVFGEAGSSYLSALTAGRPRPLSHGTIVALLCAILGFVIISLSSGKWFVFRLLLLLGGMMLSGLEMQNHAEGVRRHKMFGVQEWQEQSLRFGRGVSLILLIASGLGFVLLLAIER